MTTERIKKLNAINARYLAGLSDDARKTFNLPPKNESTTFDVKASDRLPIKLAKSELTLSFIGD